MTLLQMDALEADEFLQQSYFLFLLLSLDHDLHISSFQYYIFLCLPSYWHGDRLLMAKGVLGERQYSYVSFPIWCWVGTKP